MTEETEPAKIYCRLKPSNNSNEEQCIFYENNCNLEYLRTVPPKGSRRNAKAEKYSFNGIFNEDISQEDVYEYVAYPLVLDLIDGKNGLLFTYGVTGSGKTYTMQGNDNEPGLVSRSLKSLFNRIELLPPNRVVSNNRNGFNIVEYNPAYELKGTTKIFNRLSNEISCLSCISQINDIMVDQDKLNNCAVFVSLVEIYGKRITDLLANKNEPHKDITIKEDSKKNKYLFNTTEVEVRSAEEAYSYYLKGQRNRKVEATKLNHESSRSHMIFNIRLVELDNDLSDMNSSRNAAVAIFSQRNCSNSAQMDVGVKWPANVGHCTPTLKSDDSCEDCDQMRISQLYMVDLAGSERADRSGANGLRLKEAGYINNALMVLRQCMELLRDQNRNNAEKPDYRSNELTHLLKTALEGGSALRMVLCVQTSSQEYDETINVLQFGKRSQDIIMATQKSQEPIKLTKKDVMHGDTNELSMMQRATDIWDFVSRRRMVDPNDPDNKIDDITDLRCIDELTVKNLETLEMYNRLTAMLFEDLEQESAECDELTMKLDRERSAHCRVKKQLSELQSKCQEKETDSVNYRRKLQEKETESANCRAEMINYRRMVTKLEEENKRLQMKCLHDQVKEKEIVRTGLPVKEYVKRFEAPIVVNSKKYVSKIQPAPLPGASTRKGYYNPRFRKSKSQDRWVEHKEKNEIPTGTLSQINLKSKIQTNNPDLKMLIKSDNYLLQDQTVDSDADVTTKYHKGNIIPTAGGGVAVSLFEVETVCQSSPLKRDLKNKKRRSSSYDDSEVKRYRDD